MKVLRPTLLAASLIFFASAFSANASCDTDFNGDGVTDELDFEIFKSQFGSFDDGDSFAVAADLNADGTVDLDDFNIFLECS